MLYDPHRLASVNPPLHHLFRNGETERCCYRLGFGHHGLAQGSQAALGSEAIEGREGKGADRVEADVAPELEPDVPADGVADRRIKAGGNQGIAQGHDALRGGAVGLADSEALEQAMFDHAGRHDLAGGIDDAADGALRSNRVPLRGAGIDAFQMMAVQRAALLVEIPPGNAVHRCENGGVRTEQRSEPARAGVGLLRLQRADHDVLRAKRRGVVACRQVYRARPSLHDQLEPVAPNGRQMRTAGNGRHFMARQCEFPRHVTANRPGAEYADLHSSLLCSVIQRQTHRASRLWSVSGDLARHLPVFRDNPHIDKFAAMRVFVKIADAGNLSAAGRQLGLSLTSVSRQLMALEEALGTRLVERSTRSLSLTESGLLYYERAKQILEEVADAERGLTAQTGVASGRLHVSAPSLLGRLRLAPMLPGFLAEQTRVSIDLMLVDRPVRLAEEGIDVALRIGPLEDEKFQVMWLGAKYAATENLDVIGAY